MRTTTRKLLALANYRHKMAAIEWPGGVPTWQQRILLAHSLRRERRMRGPRAFRQWMLTVANSLHL